MEIDVCCELTEYIPTFVSNEYYITRIHNMTFLSLSEGGRTLELVLCVRDSICPSVMIPPKWCLGISTSVLGMVQG